jgi:hypothetical protein
MKKRRYRSSVLRYRSTRYRRIFDIELEVQIHSISISKNLRYPSRRSNWGPAGPARAGLLIAIAGCSSVLCTYCSVTISLQVRSIPRRRQPPFRVAGAGACPATRSRAWRAPAPAFRLRQWRPRSATKFSMVSYRILCLRSPADQHTKDSVSVAEQIGIYPNKIILLKFCFQAQRLEEQLCALGARALAKRRMLGILLASTCHEGKKLPSDCPEHSPKGICLGYFLPLP